MTRLRHLLTPAWLTAHRAVLLALLLWALSAFVVAAIDDEFGYLPSQLAKSLAVCVIVTGLVSYLCAGLVRVPPNSDSWLITGLILFFVMPVGVDSASLLAALIGSVAAGVSKYVLVWRRRLIINPVAAGAITCYALVAAGVGGLSYLPWWIAAEPLLIPSIVIGALLVTVIGDWALVLVYLIAAGLSMGFAVGFTQENLGFLLKSYPTLFLAAVMLPEPLTSPATRVPRLVYGALVGVLMFCEQTIQFTDSYTLHFDPEIALAVGCLFAFVVRLLTVTARRMPLGVSTSPIAASTYGVSAWSGGGGLRFRPGQWASVSVPTWRMPLWRSSRRVFSFASAPTAVPVEFAFTTSNPPSPYKAGLIGGTGRAYVDNVGGDFVVPSRVVQDGPVVLIASGIGITPFISMLQAWSATGTSMSNVVVLHVVRSPERAVYSELLDAAAAAGARVERVVSTELASGLDAEHIRSLVADSRAHFYVSGAPAFVAATRRAIRRAAPATRLRPWLVHTDAFTGY